MRQRSKIKKLYRYTYEQKKISSTHSSLQLALQRQTQSLKLLIDWMTLWILKKRFVSSSLLSAGVRTSFFVVKSVIPGVSEKFCVCLCHWKIVWKNALALCKLWVFLNCTQFRQRKALYSSKNPFISYNMPSSLTTQVSTWRRIIMIMIIIR